MASEMRLELIQVPVSDIDRAKAFYVEQVGFTADTDNQVTDELRFVQLTPPGSACSIARTDCSSPATPTILRRSGFIDPKPISTPTFLRSSVSPRCSLN